MLPNLIFFKIVPKNISAPFCFPYPGAPPLLRGQAASLAQCLKPSQALHWLPDLSIGFRPLKPGSIGLKPPMGRGD